MGRCIHTSAWVTNNTFRKINRFFHSRTVTMGPLIVTMMDITFRRESRLVVSFVYSISSFTLLAMFQCKGDTLHCFALFLIHYNSHMATYTIYTILIKLLYIISEYHWYSYIILLQKKTEPRAFFWLRRYIGCYYKASSVYWRWRN